MNNLINILIRLNLIIDLKRNALFVCMSCCRAVNDVPPPPKLIVLFSMDFHTRPAGCSPSLPSVINSLFLLLPGHPKLTVELKIKPQGFFF